MTEAASARKSKKRVADDEPELAPYAKRSRRCWIRVKETLSEEMYDITKWGASDDAALLRRIQAGSSFLSIAANGFNGMMWRPRQLQAQWRAILYEEEASDRAARALAAAPPLTNHRVLFSEDELKLLVQVSQPDFTGYKALFDQNRNIWKPLRTIPQIEAQVRRLQITPYSAPAKQYPLPLTNRSPTKHSTQTQKATKGTSLKESSPTAPITHRTTDKPLQTENPSTTRASRSSNTTSTITTPHKPTKTTNQQKSKESANTKLNLPENPHEMLVDEPMDASTKHRPKERPPKAPKASNSTNSVPNPSTPETSASHRQNKSIETQIPLERDPTTPKAKVHKPPKYALPEDNVAEIPRGKRATPILDVIPSSKHISRPKEVQKSSTPPIEALQPSPEEIVSQYRWSDHPNVLAVIYGAKIFYEVVTLPVLIGRKGLAPGSQQIVHINLSDEGDAAKISRNQASIDKSPEGYGFILTQLGKATTLVDDIDVRDHGSVNILKHSTLSFSKIELEWISRPPKKRYN